MDREFIKLLISPPNKQDSRLVMRGDLIDSELVDIFCNVPPENMLRGFADIKTDPSLAGVPYIIELQCPCCRRKFIRKANKNDTLKILKSVQRVRKEAHYWRIREDIERLWCEECRAKKKEEDRIEKELRDKEFAKDHEMLLNNYIERYVNPSHEFKKEIRAWEKIKSIMDKFDGEKRLEDAITSLEYHDFLNTPYWDVVRNYRLKKAEYKCELCGENGTLNVHHKTYEHHGQEHLKRIADKDLIVLCSECHQKFHDKLQD